MARPVREFWSYFLAASPAGLANCGFTDETWEGERKELGVAQQVLTEFAPQHEPGTDWFARYGIQAACYHTDKSTAADRALAVYNAILPICGLTSGGPGLALATWTAKFVDAEYIGIVDSLPIDGGGRLWKAVAQIWLLSLYQP